MSSADGGSPVVSLGSGLPASSIRATISSMSSQPSKSPWWAASRDRRRSDDSTLPLVWGPRGRHGFSSKPAALASSYARWTLRRLPPLTVTRAGMLSVAHSRGAPPSLAIVAYMHPTGSSVVLVPDRMNMCLREWPGVAANTLSSNGSPPRFAIPTDSFQSNRGCSPGGVPKRGCGSGPTEAPTAMPFSRMNWVKAS